MLNPGEIKLIINSFAAQRVGVLGDLMVDRFIYGSASRLSPEAPVPVVTIRERTIQPGGAANVGNNVLSLGGELSLFGLLGDDEAGREVAAILGRSNADLTGIKFSESRPSTIKTRVVAQSQQVVRFDEEIVSPLSRDEHIWLLEKVNAVAQQLKVLIISDYAKGMLSPHFCEQLVQLCHKHDIKMLVDPKPVNAECFVGADVLKPNLGEALMMSGYQKDPGHERMQEVCEQVLDVTGARAVIITAGVRGMYVLVAGLFKHMPGRPREVYDVAGAGDTTLAAIALAMAAGSDLISAARLGNLAGSIAVGKLGIAAVTAEELLREVERPNG